MTTMQSAIEKHRAAWEAYQVAPEGIETEDAADAETAAMSALLKTVPTGAGDLQCLRSHLDWFTEEERHERFERGIDLEAFAIHAVMVLSDAKAVALVKHARALVDAITNDDVGAMVGGIYQGGNGGLLSNQTIMVADQLRRELDGWPK